MTEKEALKELKDKFPSAKFAKKTWDLPKAERTETLVYQTEGDVIKDVASSFEDLLKSKQAS